MKENETNTLKQHWHILLIQVTYAMFGFSDLYKLYQGDRPRVGDITIEISDMFVSYSILPKPIKLSYEVECNQSKLLWSLHEIYVKCWIQTFHWFVWVVSLTLGLPP